jgi:hypothetical protein
VFVSWVCVLRFQITVGSRVPDATFKARVRDATIAGPNPFKWKDVTSADLFAGKRVVIFALPGGTVHLQSVACELAMKITSIL